MVCGVPSGLHYSRRLLESSSALWFTEPTVIPTVKCELRRRCRGWNQKGSRLPKFLFSCLLAVRLLSPFSFDKSFLEKQNEKTSVCRRRCWTATGDIVETHAGTEELGGQTLVSARSRCSELCCTKLLSGSSVRVLNPRHTSA